MGFARRSSDGRSGCPVTVQGWRDLRGADGFAGVPAGNDVRRVLTDQVDCGDIGLSSVLK